MNKMVMPLKISELVDILQRMKQEHGDLPIYTLYDGNNYPLGKSDVNILEASNLDARELPKRVLIK